MPSFTHCKNIRPSTNYLVIEEIFLTQQERQKNNSHLFIDSTHLDSLVIIHNPLFMVMAISKAMIMLAVVANLKVKQHISTYTMQTIVACDITTFFHSIINSKNVAQPSEQQKSEREYTERGA